MITCLVLFSFVSSIFFFGLVRLVLRCGFFFLQDGFEVPEPNAVVDEEETF